MIIVLLAIALVNGSSTVVLEASGSIPAQVGGEKNVLADATRTGERIQESKQILKSCVTQEACHKKAAVCFKKCNNLPAKEHEKCAARCSTKCVPSC